MGAFQETEGRKYPLVEWVVKNVKRKENFYYEMQFVIGLCPKVIL